MFIKLFIRILAIFCMMGFGMLARRLNVIDRDSASRMSRAATNFFYPALIFTTLVSNFNIKELVQNWILPAGTVVIMSTGFLLAFVFYRFIKFSGEKEENQFFFQCTINNYSFLPLPIVLMLWGNPGVAGLIFSSLGSELCVWTIGVFGLTGRRFRRDSLMQLLSVPMIAIFASVAVMALRDFAGGPSGFTPNLFLKDLGGSLFSVLDIFGKGTIPLAMFIAGSRMAELKPRHLFTATQGYVVALRLLVIPAVTSAILLLLPFPLETRMILLVVATMPSAIASVVLSEVYDSDTEFAASCVLTTHLFSLITIPLWLSLFLR
ncbi:MAG: AEC family transporter [Candidatus Omnitrophica bacterium]|nr:AEC family transporter [Candidatus Omnitrophota bacterium]